MMSKYDQQIKRIIRKFFKDDEVELILFGSRAVGREISTSDYDIALKSERQISESLIRLAKEELDNSNIPFKVDLVDYSRATAALKISIDEGGIKW